MSHQHLLFRERITNFSILIGGFFILTPGLVLVLSSIYLWIGAPYLSIYPPVITGFLGGILIVGWEVRNRFQESKTRWMVAGLLLVTFLVLFFPSWLASRRLYDLTVDGQTYHASGIYHLLHDWNPIRDKPLSINPNFYNQYVNSYPKGPWILASEFTQITGHVEDGKILNFLLLIGSFFISLSVLLAITDLKPGPAFILAVLTAFNPITLSQLPSYYVDGQLASLLVALLGIIFLWAHQPSRFLSFLLGSVIVLLVNVKFTGLVYLLIIGGALVGYSFLKYRKKVLPILCFASLMVAFFFVGFNPYVTNTIRYQNPFHPISLFSPEKTPIIDYNLPENYRVMSRVERTVNSFFAKAQTGLGETRLKFPFTVSKDELSVYEQVDLRTGGFGPLFSGTFLLSLLLWIWIGFARLPGRKTAFGFYLVLLVSVLSNPETWWARYVPQIWLLPLIPAGLVLTAKRSKGLRAFAWLTLSILAINIVLITSVNMIGHIKQTEFVKYQLYSVWLKSSQQPVQVNFSLYNMNRMRFDEWGIRYSSVNEINDCSESLQVSFSNTIVCMQSASNSTAKDQ